MTRIPSYPKDAPIGEAPETAEAEPRGEKDAESLKVAGAGRKRHMVTGAAIGIGSAALVAALLYANRSRKNDKEPGGKGKP